MPPLAPLLRLMHCTCPVSLNSSVRWTFVGSIPSFARSARCAAMLIAAAPSFGVVVEGFLCRLSWNLPLGAESFLNRPITIPSTIVYFSASTFRAVPGHMITYGTRYNASRTHSPLDPTRRHISPGAFLLLAYRSDQAVEQVRTEYSKQTQPDRRSLTISQESTPILRTHAYGPSLSSSTKLSSEKIA